MKTSLRIAANNAERRRSKREPHIVEAYVSSPTARHDEPKIEAASVNLSRHGVGFETTEPLAVAAYYTLELGLGDQRIVAEVRIISCTCTDHGNYYIGAEFH